MKKATQANPQYHIHIDISGKRTADFYYSDQEIATGHYNQIRAAGQLCGVWINSIQLNLPITPKNMNLVA